MQRNQFLLLTCHRSIAPTVESTSPLLVDLVTCNHATERESSIVVEAIMDSAVQARHSLLLSRHCVLRAILRKEMTEHDVECACAASMSRRIRRKVRQSDIVCELQGGVGLRWTNGPVVVLRFEAGNRGIGRSGVHHSKYSYRISLRHAVFCNRF